MYFAWILKLQYLSYHFEYYHILQIKFFIITLWVIDGSSYGKKIRHLIDSVVAEHFKENKKKNDKLENSFKKSCNYRT